MPPQKYDKQNQSKLMRTWTYTMGQMYPKQKSWKMQVKSKSNSKVQANREKTLSQPTLIVFSKFAIFA